MVVRERVWLATNARRSLAYRIILRAYPRSFRDQFGPDMTQLFLDRRRHGANGTALVLREAGDCLRTAPRLHLEGSMSRTVIIVLLTATVTLALAGGPIGLIPAALLAVVLVLRRDERPIGASGWHWWTWFAAGAAALAIALIVLAIDGDELTTAGWTIAFVSFNAAVVLALVGLATGASRLHQHLRTPRV